MSAAAAATNRNLDRVRMQRAAFEAAANVPDPEIPVVTVNDLGILRGVELDEAGRAVAKLTPTYSGCPAVVAIELAVEAALRDAGFEPVIERDRFRILPNLTYHVLVYRL